jgi:hypothetical protein
MDFCCGVCASQQNAKLKWPLASGSVGRESYEDAELVAVVLHAGRSAGLPAPRVTHGSDTTATRTGQAIPSP